MPRTAKSPDDPSKLQHGITVLFANAEYALVNRVAAAHGISKGAAVRMLVRAAATLPPFTPNEETEEP